MGEVWTWPGSRWWRVDLHAHSPESSDFRREVADRKDWRGWIEAAAGAHLDAVGITDHNTAAAVSEIQSAAADLPNAPVVFPGVEITASDGVHLLVLLDPACRQEHVEDLLSRVRIPVDERGSECARSTLSVEQILDELGREAILLGAHVNGPKGLLTAHEGQQRLAVLGSSHLDAVEVDPGLGVDESWLDGSKPEVGRGISQIWSSDAHATDDLGRRFTWVKMSRPDVEGLGLALMDGAASLRPATAAEPGDPNSRHGEMLIEEITVSAAKFMGRPEPMTVRFNPWLNAIIGGRGTGKSTLVDFCRKTLRRESDLDGSGHGEEGSPKKLFERRVPAAPSPEHDGLLTTGTRLEVIYRKHGERFAIAWSPSGETPAISRLVPEGRTAEAGRVYERFPVRIYSQKQLFAMAQDTDALLAVIDDSPRVQAAEKNREIEHLKSRYLSLRAQARAAAARAEGLDSRRASLSDAKHKLEFLETGGQAHRLTEYRRRRRENDTWEAVLQAARENIGALASRAEELSVPELDLASSDSGTEQSAEHLRMAHAELGRVIRDLRRVVLAGIDQARRDIDEVVAGEALERWRQTLEASETSFREASAELATRGIGDPAEYGGLIAQAAHLEREIRGLEQATEQAEEREREARRALEMYRERREDLGRARGEFASEATGGIIRVEVVPFTKRSGLPGHLAEILGTQHFEADRRALAERVLPANDEPWSWDGLDALVSDIRRFQETESEPWPTEDWRFESALKKVPPESIDRLSLYAPGDTVRVSFRDPQRGWRPLTHGSPGQQTAALLSFVLGHGEEPIILDQPEDDLDNTLIYDLLVSQLKATKLKRQVIVVTHNPNIVVHGDAEFVLSLESGEGQSRKACEGGLQEKHVRDEICRVMEGGREAFASRYRRIMTVDGPAR